jgi:hypothetical protein
VRWSRVGELHRQLDSGGRGRKELIVGFCRLLVSGRPLQPLTASAPVAFRPSNVLHLFARHLEVVEGVLKARLIDEEGEGEKSEEESQRVGARSQLICSNLLVS